MNTLNQVLENALQLPYEQQEMLIKILQNRHYESHRVEMAADAQQTLADFHAGKFRPPVSRGCYWSIAPVFARARSMRPLVLTPKFKRAFHKFVKRNTDIQQRIEDTLQQMEVDVFVPNLGTHKLRRKLDGLQSCSCGYDCRIVFSIEQDTETDSEVIILLDIGTHDEVY